MNLILTLILSTLFLQKTISDLKKQPIQLKNVVSLDDLKKFITLKHQSDSLRHRFMGNRFHNSNNFRVKDPKKHERKKRFVYQKFKLRLPNKSKMKQEEDQYNRLLKVFIKKYLDKTFAASKNSILITLLFEDILSKTFFLDIRYM